jgi:AraC-like DNA-binding protein
MPLGRWSSRVAPRCRCQWSDRPKLAEHSPSGSARLLLTRDRLGSRQRIVTKGKCCASTHQRFPPCAVSDRVLVAVTEHSSPRSSDDPSRGPDTAAATARVSTMARMLDTDLIEARDRREYVHDFVKTKMLPMEFHWSRRRRAFAHIAFAGVGGMSFCSMQSSVESVERTAALARDDSEPSIGITMRRNGVSTISQHGREVVVRPGDLVLHDSTVPFAGSYPQGCGDLAIIPLLDLGLPHDVVREVCAVRLCPGHPLAALVYDYLYRVATDSALLASPDVDFVAAPSVELLRALITTHLRSEGLAAESLHNTLRLRILEYARTHLGDPALSAEQIAAAHHISVRYLYKVLADGGVSLADWIRTHRLQACRRELSTSANTPIAIVARRHGFANMSSFSRAFRAEYGTTPSQWRHHPR